jgi:hypothetical protein
VAVPLLLREEAVSGRTPPTAIAYYAIGSLKCSSVVSTQTPHHFIYARGSLGVSTMLYSCADQM